MIIQVKKKHIKAGKRANCRRCPIAMAVREATGFKGVVVGSHIYTNIHKDHIWFNQLGSKSARYKMTQACLKFIRLFDAGQPVKPFSFRLIKAEIV